MRSRVRALLAAVAALLLILWQVHVASKSGVLYGDFHAFYCAAHAILAGANPYTAAALHPCESTPLRYGLSFAPAGVVVPAPLPGYALIMFAPLAALPYPVACVTWLLGTLLCVALSARALSILFVRPLAGMIVTLAIGFAIASVPTGEIGAPLIAALLWMAVAVRRGAWPHAALCGALAMAVPHVALPAMLGAVLLVPRARMWIAAALAVLAGLDLLCGGVRTAASYFITVLPAHARAEIGSSMQYGMTWILHALNARDALAIGGGELSYAAMVVFGLLAAHALMRRRMDPAYAVLIPPAFAVTGGTFIHYTQIMIAVPAALLLFEHNQPRVRVVFGAAFLLLAIPWMWLLGEPLLLAVYAAGCGALATLVLRCSVAVSLRVALGAAVLGGLILGAGNYFGPAYGSHGAAFAAQTALAQSSWARFVQSHWDSNGIAWWIAKAPTWAALLMLTLGCAYTVSQKDFVPAVLVEEMPVTA